METTMTTRTIYTDIIAQNPILSRKEEAELVKIIKTFKTGKRKQAAREKLFNSNIRLVLKEANYFNKCACITIDDLIGAGSEGLCLAIDNFNPKKFKTKFSTYAVYWIRQRIFILLNIFGKQVYVPAHINSKAIQYRKMQREREDMPTDQEIMKMLKISKNSLRGIRFIQQPILSLDQEYSKGVDGGFVTLRDKLFVNKDDRPDYVALKTEDRAVVREAVEDLTEVEKKVLDARYLKHDPENLAVVGKRLKLTGERIRQIEKKALGKLKRRLKNKLPHYSK